MNNAQLHRSLIRREIDIAIARPALDDAEITTRKLGDEPLVLAAPDTLDLPKGAVDLRQLSGETFVLYPEFPRPSFAEFVLNTCAGLGIEMTRRVFTMDFQTAIALVSVGEGVAIVPQAVGSVQRTGVRFHEITNPLAQTGVSVNHRLDEQGVHVRNFAAIAQKVARKTF